MLKKVNNNFRYKMMKNNYLSSLRNGLIAIIVFLNVAGYAIAGRTVFSDDLINSKTGIPNYMLSDTLPADFPKLTVNSIDNPSDGCIYLTNNSSGQGTYIIIIDKEGKPFKYLKTPLPPFDFKPQPNGLLSFQEPLKRTIGGDGWAQSIVRILDQDLNILDSVQCKSGYIADFHEFLYAANGHYFLISYDPVPMDMSSVVQGGNPNAIVIGAVVQELDADKNLVFQWRSWDHIPITDTYNPLTTSVVDYVHINGLDFDVDGNIMISSRHLNENTKINRQTGEIIWRFGGKNNQFVFINENEANAPDYFSEQHDIRRLINGNVTLFDNGNKHVPEYARAVEYTLDEVNKTATMVWEYRHEPDIVSRNQGSAQRLEGGNTLIGWGGAGFQGLPSISEVTSDKKIVFELSLPKGVTFGQTTYRAYKYPWTLGASEGTKQFQITDKNTDLDYSEQGIKVHFNDAAAQNPTDMTITRYNWAAMNVRFDIYAPWVPKYRILVDGNGKTGLDYTLIFDLTKYSWIKYPDKFKVFWRPQEGTGTFTALETSYNSSSNTLECAVKDYGEFIFGLVQPEPLAQKPVLLKPVNNYSCNYKKPVNFMWNVPGAFKRCHITIAKDDKFTDIVAEDSSVNSTLFSVKLDNNVKGYWKVRCSNSNSWGEWSDVFRFNTTMPMIQVTSPNSGAIWVKDSANNTIKWFFNSDGMLKIDLYKNKEFYRTINDTVKVNTGAIWWTVPGFLPSDDKYQIKITSIEDTTVFGFSPEYFAVRDSLVSVENWTDIVSKDISISMNKPNPAIDFTDFVVNSKQFVNANMKIINVLGQTCQEIDNIELSEGINNIRLDTKNYLSGIYIIELRTNSSIYRYIFNILNK